MTATLVQATVKYTAGQPKDYGNGPRINAVVTLAGGEDVKVWGNADDPALLALRKKQAIQLLHDGKGYKLVQPEPSAPTAAPPTPSLDGPVMTDEAKRQIARYIDSMAPLYAYCYQQAQAQPGLQQAPDAAIQAAASSLFIAAQRRFGLV